MEGSAASPTCEESQTLWILLAQLRAAQAEFRQAQARISYVEACIHVKAVEQASPASEAPCERVAPAVHLPSRIEAPGSAPTRSLLAQQLGAGLTQASRPSQNPELVNASSSSSRRSSASTSQLGPDSGAYGLANGGPGRGRGRKRRVTDSPPQPRIASSSHQQGKKAPARQINGRNCLQQREAANSPRQESDGALPQHALASGVERDFVARAVQKQLRDIAGPSGQDPSPEDRTNPRVMAEGVDGTESPISRADNATRKRQRIAENRERRASAPPIAGIGHLPLRTRTLPQSLARAEAPTNATAAAVAGSASAGGAPQRARPSSRRTGTGSVGRAQSALVSVPAQVPGTVQVTAGQPRSDVPNDSGRSMLTQTHGSVVATSECWPRWTAMPGSTSLEDSGDFATMADSSSESVGGGRGVALAGSNRPQTDGAELQRQFDQARQALESYHIQQQQDHHHQQEADQQEADQQHGAQQRHEHAGRQRQLQSRSQHQRGCSQPENGGASTVLGGAGLRDFDLTQSDSAAVQRVGHSGLPATDEDGQDGLLPESLMEQGEDVLSGPVGSPGQRDMSLALSPGVDALVDGFDPFQTPLPPPPGDYYSA